jgi:Icc-related predicted phosphoesterase
VRKASARNRSEERPIRRVICISDTHGLHRGLNLPEGDLLIHAGDFMFHGKSVDEIDDFNAWLGEQPHSYKIVVAGNHDLLFASKPAEARRHLTSAVYLENSGVTLGGLTFWGSPMTPVLSHWAFPIERGAESRQLWNKIPVETDVLITHGPPFGTLDQADILSPRMGCEELTRAIVRIKPKLHVFGHVHGGYGQELGPRGARLVNCAVLNEEYALSNQPISVDLD